MYQMIKNGKSVEVQEPWSREFRPSATYEPIDPARVIGVDTESFRWDGRLATVMLPIHTITDPVMIDLRPGDSPIVHLFDWLVNTYGQHEDRPSRTRQRPQGVRKERRGGRSDGRDGRRETVNPLVLVWYNAEYDLGRLIEQEQSLLRSVLMGQDSIEVTAGPYRLEIAHMCPTGSAPSFEWYVRDPERKLVVRLIGRDMWGYWKGGLEQTAKALRGMGVTSKIKIAGELGDDVFERDWLSLSEAEKEAIRRYALQDSKTTREIYLATVDLLVHIDARVIRSDGTIPASAPGAAAKIAFQKAFDIEGLKTWSRPPKWVSQFGLDAYAGGRVFCRKSGLVTDLTVLDITSAYPDAMRWLPDPARCEYVRVKPGLFHVEQFRGKWGTLTISGCGIDPHFPALRIHDPVHNRLRYVYGSFQQITATIPEIMLGVASGRLLVDQVHDGVIMVGTADTSFLRIYVEMVFRIKEENERDTPLYLIAKLLMNSLYGKLIEVREVIRSPLGMDGMYLIPNWLDLTDPEFVKQLREIYITDGIAGLNEFWECNSDLAVNEQQPEVLLKEAISANEFAAGHYFLPLHAANVTGFVSAKLGLAAWATDALQGDTDSIFTTTPDLDAYYQVMARAGYPAPETGLGSFGLDIDGVSGVLVKTKMYSLRRGDGKFKQAHHGIIRLLTPGLDQVNDPDPERQAKLRKVRQQEHLHDVMVSLVAEGEVNYDTKSRPVRLRSAVRRGLIPGEFYAEARKIALTDDPNLERSPDGYFVWRAMER